MSLSRLKTQLRRLLADEPGNSRCPECYYRFAAGELERIGDRLLDEIVADLPRRRGDNAAAQEKGDPHERACCPRCGTQINGMLDLSFDPMVRACQRADNKRDKREGQASE